MGNRWLLLLLLILLTSLLVCPVLKSAATDFAFTSMMKDITTPITTVPVPTNKPTTPSSVFNPTVSNPDSPAAAATNPLNPMMNPAPATASPFSSTASASASASASWCVASQSSSKAALQVALDYACGHGEADCSAIQPNGSCYNPATIRDHASYAFNSYYQKNPIPTSCNFGGTAVTTSTDPSYGACQYASTSTSSSILNTTNSRGSRVYGAGRPITPNSAATMPQGRILLFLFLEYLSLIHKN